MKNLKLIKGFSTHSVQTQHLQLLECYQKRLISSVTQITLFDVKKREMSNFGIYVTIFQPTIGIVTLGPQRLQYLAD